MSPPALFSSYVAGTSWLHRTPFAVKLVAVALIGAGTWWVPSWPWALALTAALVVTASRSGLGLRRLGRSVRPLALVLVALFIYHVWANGPAEGARIVLAMLNAFLGAALLLATTQTSELLDGLVRLARPLRRWVDPEVVALTIGLVLRSIPWLFGSWDRVREAAAARGIERRPQALVLPFVIAAVGYAQTTGDALAARGIIDGPADDPGVPDQTQPDGREVSGPGAPRRPDGTG